MDAKFVEEAAETHRDAIRIIKRNTVIPALCLNLACAPFSLRIL